MEDVMYFEYNSTPNLSTAKIWDFGYRAKNGVIHCLECRGGIEWCEHIEEVTKHSGDAKLIWGFPPDFAMLIRVPMFPTSNLWADVELGQVDNDNPNKRPIFTKVFKDSHKIETLHRGEGRATIRELLIEYMWANMPPRYMVCNAAHHSLEQQFKWTQAMESNLKVREFWSVFTTDWCTFCTESVGDISGFAPEKEGSGVWNG